MAPASGCKNPHARFWTASARVKSETDIRMSWVSGWRKMPRDCLRHMLRVSISEAPIRMGSVGRRICSRGMVFLLPLVCNLKTAARDAVRFKYTDLCNYGMDGVVVKAKGFRLSHGFPACKTGHEGADSRNRRPAVLFAGHSGDRRRYHRGRGRHQQAHALQPFSLQGRADIDRSEERRVGKECRSRWAPDHYKK